MVSNRSDIACLDHHSLAQLAFDRQAPLLYLRIAQIPVNGADISKIRLRAAEAADSGTRIILDSGRSGEDVCIAIGPRERRCSRQGWPLYERDRET